MLAASESDPDVHWYQQQITAGTLLCERSVISNSVLVGGWKTWGHRLGASPAPTCTEAEITCRYFSETDSWFYFVTKTLLKIIQAVNDNNGPGDLPRSFASLQHRSSYRRNIATSLVENTVLKVWKRQPGLNQTFYVHNYHGNRISHFELYVTPNKTWSY